MNGDDEKLIKRIFAPMTADIAVIKNEQKHQGDYIEALQGDVRGIHDKVDRMPDTWRGEFSVALSDCRERRDEITSVTNVARERERGTRDRSASLIPAATKRWMVKLLPYVVLGLAFIGALVMTKVSGPDVAAFDKALKVIERVEAKVDEMNGKEEGTDAP